MEGLITGALAAALEAGREKFNAHFAQAKQIRPRLEAADWADYLRTQFAALIQAVDQAQPERTVQTVEALYPLSLQLVSEKIIGRGAKDPAIDIAYHRVLTALPLMVARHTQAFAGSMLNALHNLRRVPGVDVEGWVGRMVAVGAESPSLETYRAAGQVAAWRSGMAHYREGALAICASLAPRITALALGLPREDEASVPTMLDRLRADPWAAISTQPGTPALKLVARVGAFRGFGGQFMVPPRVQPLRAGLIVTDGESAFRLYADAFGAVLLPESPSSFPDGHAPIHPFQIAQNGRVSLCDNAAIFPELAKPLSFAATDHMLAITLPHSHSIYLVAAA